MRRASVLALLVACHPPVASTAAALDTPSAFVVLHKFAVADGVSVRGALLELGGRLYGLAGEAGPNAVDNCYTTANWSLPPHLYGCPGTLFSLKLDGTDYKVEHAFTQLDPTTSHNADGYHPYGSLALGPDGRLHGVTQVGGSAGAGVLFSYDPASSTFAVDHMFSFREDATPMGAVAVMPDGSVVGTTVNSGGSVFVLTPAGKFSFLKLDATAIGIAPYGGLTAHGAVAEGMTFAQGPAGRGTYFTFDPSVMTAKPIAAFTAFTNNVAGQGNTPDQWPLVLSNGQVVAAREYAGAHGTGELVRIDKGGLTVLRELDDIPQTATPRFSNTTGGMPNGQLAEGPDGMVYAAMMYGGTNGAGAIVRLARDGSLYQLLYSFAVGGASYPYGGLTLGSDGAFYGTTFVQGAVYRFRPLTTAAAVVCQ